MFVEEYLKDLRQDRYRPSAVARYVSRCWERAKSDVAANPQGARSVLLLGLVLFGLAFVASVGLAVSTDLAAARATLAWTGLWLLLLTTGIFLHIGLLRDRDGYPLSYINLPTAITTFRLALVPVLAVMLIDGHWRIAFWIFIIGSLSDVVDGWLARRWRQETSLGMVLDPISDIFFHLCLFISMYAAGLVGTWIIALALVRYSGLLLGGAFLYITRGPVRIQSTLPGKVSGFIFGVLIGFLLLIPSYGAGSLGPILRPLARDAVAILLAASVVHAAVMGWFNFKNAALGAEDSSKVIRGVRFGEPKK